ncbi:MAG: HAD family phosphatase [Verrucomicrobia bacterium]|nr:HAD family phosphatase [Verrucomicrobiota bacterium]
MATDSLPPKFAVVFDFDGLIVDSETPEFEAHRQIFAEHGVELTAEEWRGEVGIWSATRNWFAKLGEIIGRPVDSNALREEKRRRFWRVIKMEPLPGVRALLDELHAAAVPLALASSAEASWINRATAELDVTRYFRTIVTGDDVTHRKPHPEGYLLAARRLGIAPDRCVAIEDSQPGIVAAKAAGMKAIAIPNWLTAEHDLDAADLRVASAAELSMAVLAKLTTDGAE